MRALAKKDEYVGVDEACRKTELNKGEPVIVDEAYCKAGMNEGEAFPKEDEPVELDETGHKAELRLN